MLYALVALLCFVALGILIDPELAGLAAFNRP
jgi:hypothetical protein